MTSRTTLLHLGGQSVDVAPYRFWPWKELVEVLASKSYSEPNQTLRDLSGHETLPIPPSVGGPQYRFSATEVLGLAELGSRLHVAMDYLKRFQCLGVPVALGSASQKGGTILDGFEQRPSANVEVGGDWIRRAKPDLEVSLVCARYLRDVSSDYVVFKDVKVTPYAIDVGLDEVQSIELAAGRTI